MRDARSTTLGKVGEWGSGGTPKSTEVSYYGGDIPWIRSGDLPDGPVLEHQVSITKAGMENSSAKWVPEGAILIALYGATIGKLGITTYRVATNQAVAYCIPKKEVTSAEYLFWFLLSERDELIAIAQGGAQPNISQTILKSRQLILPPLREQCKIVAKLDSLFRRSKSARQDLVRIPRLVERYKQAILAAAFAGDATAKWRAAHPALTPVSFEEQTSVTRKREGGSSTQSSRRSPLPRTWKMATVGAVGEVILGRQRSPENHTGPNMRPYVRAANITWTGWDLSDVKQMNFDEDDFQKFKLHPGDVLINEGSGSADEVGKPAIWNGEIKNCCFQNTLIAVRPHATTSEYLYFALLHAALSRAFVDEARGVNIHHIGRAGLAQFVIPVAPIEEQEEIVHWTKSSFQRITRVAAETSRAVQLLDWLDQAALGKGFRGDRQLSEHRSSRNGRRE